MSHRWVLRIRYGMGCGRPRIHLVGSHAVPVHVVCQKIGFSHSECTFDCGDSLCLKLVMESQVIDRLHEGIEGIPLTVYLRQIAERDLRQFYHRGSVLFKRRVRITPQSLETGPRIDGGDTKNGPAGKQRFRLCRVRWQRVLPCLSTPFSASAVPLWAAIVQFPTPLGILG